MDVELILQIEERAGQLDALDYFEILRLPRGAGAAEVKAAYYRESRSFHPDRFAALPSPDLRELVARIYRRVNEAYTVLRDDDRRQRYLAEVSGPERARKLRFTETDEAALQDEQKRRAEEQLGQTPNGRKLYAAALQDVAAQRWDAAARALRTALMYEPGNARFQELLDQVERSRPRADPFKIR